MALNSQLTDAERRIHDKRKSREIICDYSGCRNVAVELRVVREIASKVAVCAEHRNLSAHTVKSSD